MGTLEPQFDYSNYTINARQLLQENLPECAKHLADYYLNITTNNEGDSLT